jgi:aryl-alcohol dehydrogenase-like predicted oxidoreductase
MFGDQTAQHDAADIVAHAHASGVNHFDTADSYSQGASEAMVDDLVRPGHPSAPCYANPVYPLIGRFTGEHSH